MVIVVIKQSAQTFFVEEKPEHIRDRKWRSWSWRLFNFICNEGEGEGEGVGES